MKKRWILVVGALIVTGCGDESLTEDSGWFDDTPDPVVEDADGDVTEYDMDEIADTAARLFDGSRRATYPVLKASDRGYSPGQIAYGIETGLIDASGQIDGVAKAWRGEDFLPVAFRGERAAPWHLDSLASKGPLPFRSASGDEANECVPGLDCKFTAIRDDDQGARWLTWVLGTTASGYTVRQIKEYLDRHESLSDIDPPVSLGLPIIVDSDGARVDPELPTSVLWPYQGANVLRDLFADEDLDFDDKLAIPVIGLTNAGYSPEQITAAVKENGIGLCSSQADSSASDAAFTTCWVAGDGQTIVQPDETTPYSPASIVMADAAPIWTDSTSSDTAGPPDTSGSPDTAGPPDTTGADATPEQPSGEKVNFTLVPYIPSPDTDFEITGHEMVMTIQRAEGTTAELYDVSGSWAVTFVRTEDHPYNNASAGETHLYQGEFATESPVNLDTDRRIPGSWWGTVRTPDGEIKEENYGEVENAVHIFRVDDTLEGEGSLHSWYVGINWDSTRDE